MLLRYNVLHHWKQNITKPLQLIIMILSEIVFGKRNTPCDKDIGVLWRFCSRSQAPFSRSADIHDYLCQIRPIRYCACFTLHTSPSLSGTYGLQGHTSASTEIPRDRYSRLGLFEVSGLFVHILLGIPMLFCYDIIYTSLLFGRPPRMLSSLASTLFSLFHSQHHVQQWQREGSGGKAT
jgi:hypothetical protein